MEELTKSDHVYPHSNGMLTNCRFFFNKCSNRLAQKKEMKIRKFVSILSISFVLFSCSQQPNNRLTIGEFKSITTQERTIQVVGSSEMEITPDDFEFIIEIREYFEEEFQKNKQWGDYKTKVPLKKIEKKLFKKLNRLGIRTSEIMTVGVGNHWRYEGKSIQTNKEFRIKIEDEELINRLISNLDMRGLESISLGELKSKKIQKYRMEVKKEALKSAKSKAESLLETVGKKTGEIISVKELKNEEPHFNWFYSYKSPTSNSTVSDGNAAENNSFNKIKLRFEIEATFEIIN